MIPATIKNAKIGDEVKYQLTKPYYGQRGHVNPHPVVISKVKNITASMQMIRLEDGTLWNSNGRGRGELHHTILRLYTPEARLQEARDQAVSYIKGFVGSKLDDLKPEDTLKLLAAIMEIETGFGSVGE